MGNVVRAAKRVDPSLVIENFRQFFASKGSIDIFTNSFSRDKPKGSALANKKITIVFVLGGPGSGKGTQCTNIAQNFGYTHLSVGELLRSVRDCASENWNLTAAELDMITKMMATGTIIPSDITIKLLEHAMLKNDNNKFLIDGFPRNEENRAAFESLIGIEPEFIIFFDCSQEEMERRLLSRNQGRDDDTIDTIKKRFKVYLEDTLPVIEYYNSKGKVRKIDATKPIDEVFDAVKACFTPSADKVAY